MGPPLFGLHPIRDFSHLDYRWTTKPFGLHPMGLPMTFGLPPFGLQRLWTIPIGLLAHVDYQNLDYIPNRLHCHLDYIRISVQNILDCAMYFQLKGLKKT